MSTWDLARHVWRSVPDSRWRTIASMLLAAAATGASVALLGVSAWLIARAAEMPPIMFLNVAVVGVRFFGISRGFFRYVERLVSHDLALRLQKALRIDVYDHLRRSTMLGRRRGDLLARAVADVEAIMDLLVRVIGPFASASIVIVGASAILGRFSWPNAAVLLTTAVVAGVLVPAWAARASRAADRSIAPLRGELAGLTQEYERTLTDLVAYEADAGFRERLHDVDARLRASEARAAWVRGIAEGVQLLALALAVGAGVWFGAQAAGASEIPARMIAVLAMVPLALHESLGDLARAAQTLTRTEGSLQRIAALLGEPTMPGAEREDSPTGATAVIALRDVAIGWPGGGIVRDHVTLAVGPGDRHGIQGPSGIGKTTLAATILGLIPERGGSLEVVGRVGYLAQDAHIFSTSVAENVRIGHKDASDAEVREALDRAGLAHLDLDRVVGEFGTAVSGGEARRLALSRLIVGSFDVVVLDEPTEHLDEATATALMADVWEAIDDRPTIAISHDPLVLDACSTRTTWDRPTSADAQEAHRRA